MIEHSLSAAHADHRTSQDKQGGEGSLTFGPGSPFWGIVFCAGREMLRGPGDIPRPRSCDSQSCKLLFLKAQFPPPAESGHLPTLPTGTPAPACRSGLGACTAQGRQQHSAELLLPPGHRRPLSLSVTALHCLPVPSQLMKPQSVCPLRERQEVGHRPCGSGRPGSSRAHHA